MTTDPRYTTEYARLADDDDQGLIAADDVMWHGNNRLAAAIDDAWATMCGEADVMLSGALPSEL